MLDDDDDIANVVEIDEVDELLLIDKTDFLEQLQVVDDELHIIIQIVVWIVDELELSE